MHLISQVSLPEGQSVAIAMKAMTPAWYVVAGADTTMMSFDVLTLLIEDEDKGLFALDDCCPIYCHNGQSCCPCQLALALPK